MEERTYISLWITRILPVTGLETQRKNILEEGRERKGRRRNGGRDVGRDTHREATERATGSFCGFLITWVYF